MGKKSKAFVPTAPVPDQVPNAEQEVVPSANSSALANLAYFFVAICVAGVALLIRDSTLPRKHPVFKTILFWKMNPVLDRIAFVLFCFLGFFMLAIIFQRRALVSVCKRGYRSARTELINGWKTFWRTRHRSLFQYVVLAGHASLAAICWRSLILATNCEAPVVVVLSGSMEPAFYRGDILFLTNSVSDEILPGEIVVFRIKDREIPIVHRCMHVHENATEAGETLYLTKGDNNNGHDRPLYAPGQLWLKREDFMGRARFFVPYVGMITVKINEYPLIKYTVIAGLVLLTLYTKEL